MNYLPFLENHVKSQGKPNFDDKKNANEIVYKGHNAFYLTQDNIFSLFNTEYDDIENMKLLQIMSRVYTEYIKNNIHVENDYFLPALFYRLNKTNDFSCIDFIIKNKNILINKNLGIYLIDRSKAMKEKNYKDSAFNLGIEILMMDLENINDVLFELNDERKYNETLSIIIDFYIGYRFDKKDKNIKNDANKHLNKFITSKLGSGVKNKSRYITSIGEEENNV